VVESVGRIDQVGRCTAGFSVKQHEEVLKAGLTHPGVLDPATTVMAIWPAPMVYGGPIELQFHAKSRRSAGASYFVVRRDPAGMKGSQNAGNQNAALGQKWRRPIFGRTHSD
jgi:ATP sulfurylase